MVFIFSCKSGNKNFSTKNTLLNTDTIERDSASIFSTNIKPYGNNKLHNFSEHVTYSALDSILKYEKADSEYIFNNNISDTFYSHIGWANGIEFGLAPSTDSTFDCFQKLNHQWGKMATINTYGDEIVYIHLMGLREDKYKDIIVTINVTASGGNEENRVLVFDRRNKMFVYNEFWDLPNIRYDKKKHIIESSWWGGSVSSGAQKEIFSISGDSLTLIKGVSWTPLDIERNDSAIIEYYSERKKKEITLSKHMAKSEKIYEEFNLALWDSSNEY